MSDADLEWKISQKRVSKDSEVITLSLDTSQFAVILWQTC